MRCLRRKGSGQRISFDEVVVTVEGTIFFSKFSHASRLLPSSRHSMETLERRQTQLIARRYWVCHAFCTLRAIGSHNEFFVARICVHGSLSWPGVCQAQFRARIILGPSAEIQVDPWPPFLRKAPQRLRQLEENACTLQINPKTH